MSAFFGSGDTLEVKSMLLRIIDYLKSSGITGLFTHLSDTQGAIETDTGLSSLMDAWILLLSREANGEFNRELYLLKARGIAHSNQVREFVMTDQGIRLIAPYLGNGTAVTGAARRTEEAKSQREELKRKKLAAGVKEQIEHRRRRAQAQLDVLKAELDADEAELNRLTSDETDYLRQASADTDALAKKRGNL
ncbi:MAG TPA: ATPase domain-containing protein [Methylovirgula sp.]